MRSSEEIASAIFARRKEYLARKKKTVRQWTALACGCLMVAGCVAAWRNALPEAADRQQIPSSEPAKMQIATAPGAVATGKPAQETNPPDTEHQNENFPPPGVPGAVHEEITCTLEEAEEKFGHRLMPCTDENFLGYSLGAVSDRGSQTSPAQYWDVTYVFSDGTIMVIDQDRTFGDLYTSLPDQTRVEWNEAVFYLREGYPEEGQWMAWFCPNGGQGLIYSACFSEETGRDRVFSLLLALEYQEGTV